MINIEGGGGGVVFKTSRKYFEANLSSAFHFFGMNL